MRISDWSSDVCSSDLVGPFLFEAVEFLPVLGAVAVARAEVAPLPALELEELLVAPVEPPVVPDPVILAAARDARIRVEHPGDRKSVVEGKSGSVRVELGGRRLL